MIAQLTHLRPKAEHFDDVIKLLEAWGAETASDPDGPQNSFVSQDRDHLFVVSLYLDEAAYKRAIAKHDHRRAALMALLIENHGPTFFGPVLSVSSQGDSARISGLFIPPAA